MKEAFACVHVAHFTKLNTLVSYLVNGIKIVALFLPLCDAIFLLVIVLMAFFGADVDGFYFGQSDKCG